MANDDLAHLRKQRKRKKKKRSLLVTAVTIVLIAVLITALLLVLDSRSASIRLAFFNSGSIEKTVKASALILREEELLSSPQGGSLYPLYNSGRKVSSSEPLAVVLNPINLDQLNTLHSLEKQIYHRQSVLLKDTNLAPGVLEAIRKNRNEVSKAIGSARFAAASGDIAAMEQAGADINKLAGFSLEATDRIDFADEELNNLLSRYDLLQDSFRAGGLGSVIASPRPGWMSYRNDVNTSIDLFNWANIGAGQLENLLAASADSQLPAYPAEIQAGEKALSLITGKEQYLAFLLPELKSADLSFEKKYKIESLSNEIKMSNCELVRCETSGNGLLAVFKTREAIDLYADYWQDEFSISLSSHKGLMLPITSLLDISADQKAAKIMKVVGGKTEIVPVIIEATDGFYVLVRGRDGDPLAPKEADIYVRNPENIAAGIIID